MKTNQILTLAAIAAVVSFTPSLMAKDCSSSKKETAATSCSSKKETAATSCSSKKESAAACSASKKETAATYSAGKDLVSVASGADNFKTLVAAVKAAGLVETLQGEGPFTVFAPTDAAFAKLPAGTVENLLKPENKEKLVAILTYHVVPGKVMAADVKTMKAKTVNGQELDLKVDGTDVTVNNAKVAKTDVKASNGVIHVIDSVVLPN